MTNAPRNQLFIAICALGLAATGCAVDDVDDRDNLTSVAQALQCQDSGCDGMLPQDTNCVFDPGLGIVADGQIFQAGVQIGGIGLFYSPQCHTIWASTAFYQPQSHRTCAVRRATPDNLAVCKDYPGSMGNVSPMRHLGIGKTGFGRTVLLTDPTVTARTGDFTRSF